MGAPPAPVAGMVRPLEQEDKVVSRSVVAVCMAEVMMDARGPWLDAVAMLRVPGTTGGVSLILVGDGTLVRDMYTYRLRGELGSFVVPEARVG